MLNHKKGKYWNVSWNPITGCSPISEGCQNCWARRMATRLKGRYGYPADDPFKVTYHPDRLDQPLKWKRPKVIYVCLMGDLFHADVPFYLIDDVFDVIRRLQQHTFLILTKRPWRMCEWSNSTNARGVDLLGNCPNLWVGVTVEGPGQKQRISNLLQIPAAVRWVSYEPALGPVDFAGDDGGHHYFPFENEQGTITPGLNWIVAGGETGPGARPAHPDWFRKVKDDCVAAGIPFYFKQWGEWVPVLQISNDFKPITKKDVLKRAHIWYDKNGHREDVSFKVGKKTAGRVLDGRTWNEMPKVRKGGAG